MKINKEQRKMNKMLSSDSEMLSEDLKLKDKKMLFMRDKLSREEKLTLKLKKLK